MKSTTKGHRKRLENATPIYNLQDEKNNWLKSVSNWLKQWKQHHDAHSTGFQTKETYTALLHTMDTFVLLFTELFEQYELHYILTGKFQTDNLEARFGLYRMLSGSNYIVSVIEVLQSEKKLKLKGFLKLYSASKGIIKIKDFFLEFSGTVSKSHYDKEFVVEFFL